MERNDNTDHARWWRRLCWVVPGRLVVTGDLPADPAEAGVQLAAWVDAGVTHILDTRIEWSDEALVLDAAPNIHYLHNGADDAGQRMPDAWFDRGVAFALPALAQRGTAVLVHCHMGINRGPSLAYAILLALGVDPVEALDAIRSARPIAAVAYAEDALEWHHRRSGADPLTLTHHRRRVAAWRRAHPLDVVRIIGDIRNRLRTDPTLPDEQSA